MSNKKDSPKAPKATKPVLEAATAAMEVPSGEKKETLKKTEPKTFKKYRVELKDEERQFLNFELIKNRIHDPAFAKALISHHIAENLKENLTPEVWERLQASVKFSDSELEMYERKNKSLTEAQCYKDTLATLRDSGLDAGKLTYDAISITRVLMRIARGKKVIINDVQCLTMRADKFLAANNHGEEFEDRGSRIGTPNEQFACINTLRSLKGKFYNSNTRGE